MYVHYPILNSILKEPFNPFVKIIQFNLFIIILLLIRPKNNFCLNQKANIHAIIIFDSISRHID